MFSSPGKASSCSVTGRQGARDGDREMAGAAQEVRYRIQATGERGRRGGMRQGSESEVQGLRGSWGEAVKVVEGCGSLLT